MREMLLGAARVGLYTPLWSARILEEWARAAARHGAGQEMQARSDIALDQIAFPTAIVPEAKGLEQRLWLPDPNDIHVLASAISSSADGIITLNRKDFPRSILAEEGVTRTDPDAFLYQLWLAEPGAIETAARAVLAKAQELSDRPWEMRALLKKARLPRVAKALSDIET